MPIWTVVSELTLKADNGVKNMNKMSTDNTVPNIFLLLDPGLPVAGDLIAFPPIYALM